jgi:hypothetical protein
MNNLTVKQALAAQVTHEKLSIIQLELTFKDYRIIRSFSFS